MTNQTHDGERVSVSPEQMQAIADQSGVDERCTDENVEANVSLLRQRAHVGLKKYGMTTERTDLSHAQWLQHALEEALDMANYLQAALQAQPSAPANPNGRHNPSVTLMKNLRYAALEEAALICESPDQELEIGKCCAVAIRRRIPATPADMPASDAASNAAHALVKMHEARADFNQLVELLGFDVKRIRKEDGSVNWTMLEAGMKTRDDLAGKPIFDLPVELAEFKKWLATHDPQLSALLTNAAHSKIAAAPKECASAMTDERAWQIAVDLFGTTLRDTRHPEHVEITNQCAAGEFARAIEAAAPASVQAADAKSNLKMIIAELINGYRGETLSGMQGFEMPSDFPRRIARMNAALQSAGDNGDKTALQTKQPAEQGSKESGDSRHE